MITRRRLAIAGLIVLVLLALLSVAAYREIDRLLIDDPAGVTLPAHPYRFNFTDYEVRAITAKVINTGRRLGAHLTVEEQRRLVEQYLQRARYIDYLEYNIERIFADPAITDPVEASKELEAQLQKLRSTQDDVRPLVEAALERQVSEMLADLDLETDGVMWPPLRFNFSEPPNYLIVSPRDHIEVEAGLHLRPQLDLPLIETIEQKVSAEFDRSALIEGLGGQGAWPAIVNDGASLSWILSTIAHEWVHNYMVFHPLGRNMFDGPGMNTINETVATIIGDEVGDEIAFEIYGIPRPERIPPASANTPLPEPDPDRFDFRTEMRRTRLHVDELLAEGRVQEAEDYMEARRQKFVENGYIIRKLNQAYFAFHGSYATGAASSDPVGPKLWELRDLMPDLATFVRATQTITSLDDLDALLGEWRAHPATTIGT
ncbi:MAG: hypothetical protein J5I90_08630 [Caldilineales bacterium]|nr:hypothetical protein [Caldilineales bacterium]